MVLEPESDTHLVVAQSHMRFVRPVTSTLRAHCPMPRAAAIAAFLDTLHHRHKARIELQCQIVDHTVVCADFSGHFVAYPAGAPAG